MAIVSSDGVRTRYEVVGKGPPLLLHVGFLGSLEDWSREDTGYVQALRDRYRLILIDPRGQGQSDAPHDGSLYTTEARARDIVAVLDAIEVEQTHYWGYSMGGTVGLMLGARFQNRLKSLIIGGASPFRVSGDPTSTPLYRWLEQGMSGFVAEWEQAIGPLPAGARERWLAGDAEALRAAMLAPNQSPQIIAGLGEISVPALLYAGSDDHPELVEEAAAVIPGARFVRLEGLDHAQAFRRSDMILPHATAFLMEADTEFASA